MKITLLFPDDKQVTIEGDTDRVLEIVRSFEEATGFISHERVSYSESSYIDPKVLEELINKTKEQS